MSDYTWRENLCRALRQYLPWAQLPEVVLKPLLRLAPAKSQSSSVISAMIYARALSDDIADQRRRGAGGFDPWPRILTTTLDAALEIVHHHFVDEAGAALAEWRGELAMRRAA